MRLRAKPCSWAPLNTTWPARCAPVVHTTPESRDLFELMAEGAERGATELVTEVSSHALDQGRAAGVNFDVAVFTNLTRDHLDYHQTMEKYFAAKRLLFDGTVYPAPRVAVINAHDPRAEELAEAARKAGAESSHLWNRHGRLARCKLLAYSRRRSTRTGNSGGRGQSDFASGRRGEYSQPAGCA